MSVPGGLAPPVAAALKPGLPQDQPAASSGAGLASAPDATASTDGRPLNIPPPASTIITAGSAFEKPIETMPGHSQRSVDRLDAEIDELVALGIPSVLLFGIPAAKDARGTSAYDPDGPVPRATRAIKARAPEMIVHGLRSPRHIAAWYYSATYSWGFALLGDALSRNSCDVGSTNSQKTSLKSSFDGMMSMYTGKSG